MSDEREAIPEPMKREIRQRCGFGCVICGLPIYEYEHMEGWANTRRHIADEITLLCNLHHAEKTKGLLPLDQVKSANAAPHNIGQGVSSPYGLHFSGDTCHIAMGSATFSGSQTKVIPVAIHDKEIISFHFANGQLFLGAQIYDRSGELALLIHENELVYSTKPWDIEFVGKTLTVRHDSGDILLDMAFVPPMAINIKRMNLNFDGNEVHVDKNGVYAQAAGGSGAAFQNSHVDGAQYGAVLHCTGAVGFAAIRLP